MSDLTDLVNFAVISDPSDPKFDLEAYLKFSEAKGGSLA